MSIVTKYQYSGYGIGFDGKSSFSFRRRGFGQNVIIFGADMTSSVHVDNKKKGHFNSWKRSNSRIRTYTDCKRLTAEKVYSINFTVTRKKFC